MNDWDKVNNIVFSPFRKDRTVMSTEISAKDRARLYRHLAEMADSGEENLEALVFNSIRVVRYKAEFPSVDKVTGAKLPDPEFDENDRLMLIRYIKGIRNGSGPMIVDLITAKRIAERLRPELESIMNGKETIKFVWGSPEATA